MYNDYDFHHDDDRSLYSETEQDSSYIDSTVVSDHSSAEGTGSGKPPKKKKSMGLLRKFALCVSFAAVFGMIAAGVFIGTETLVGKTTTSKALQTTAEADSSVSTEKTTNNTVTNTTTNNETSVGTTGSSTDTSGDLTTVEVASTSMPALVSITNKSVQEVQNYFGGMGGFGNSSNNTQSVEETSMGSGVIIGQTDDVIYIVTNEHVIDSAQTLTVAFVDDSTASGTVIGSDSTNDIAVVSVKKSDLTSDTLSKIKVMELGDSDSLVVGQQVIAIGNALGYGQSVSEGIVSALNRSMDGGTGIYAEGLIQTDAAINPGNSGGALLNMKGQLIGINSAKYADTSVEGMGYALPITKIQPIVESMIEGTYTSADTTTSNSTSSDSSSSDGSSTVTSDAYLGVSCIGISQEYASYYNIPEGVYLQSVATGSAAEKAGLKAGDIITAIDGTSINSVDGLTAILNQHSSGDTVKMTVSTQSGNSYTSSTVSVTFGSKTSSQQKTAYDMH